MLGVWRERNPKNARPYPSWASVSPPMPEGWLLWPLSWHLRLVLYISSLPAHHQEQLVGLLFLPSPPPVLYPLPTKSQEKGDFHPGVVIPLRCPQLVGPQAVASET